MKLLTEYILKHFNLGTIFTMVKKNTIGNVNETQADKGNIFLSL